MAQNRRSTDRPAPDGRDLENTEIWGAIANLEAPAYGDSRRRHAPEQPIPIVSLREREPTLIDYLSNLRAHRLRVFKEDIWQFFNFGA